MATWPHAEFERTPVSTSTATAVVIPPVEPPVETAGEEVPPDDPSIPRVDVNGRDPEEVVIDFVDACNNANWKAAYALYANPGLDQASYAREREAVREIMRDFTVYESRVMDEDTAAVRVGYSIPATGVAEAVVIDAPGEWWGVSLVDGEWKVNWLSRQ